MYNDTKNIVDPWIKERGYISAIQQRPYAFSMNNSWTRGDAIGSVSPTQQRTCIFYQ